MRLSPTLRPLPTSTRCPEGLGTLACCLGALPIPFTPVPWNVELVFASCTLSSLPSADWGVIFVSLTRHPDRSSAHLLYRALHHARQPVPALSGNESSRTVQVESEHPRLPGLCLTTDSPILIISGTGKDTGPDYRADRLKAGDGRAALGVLAFRGQE